MTGAALTISMCDQSDAGSIVRDKATRSAANKIHWTASLVEERLEEAARVLKRLPPAKVGGYFSVWPKIIPEFSDLVGQEPRPMRRPCPSPAEISRMEKTLWWTVDLESDDAKIVLMRASGERWKSIGARFGMIVPTARNHWLYALCIIARQLNGKPFPSNLSRNQMLAIARFGDGKGKIT